MAVPRLSTSALQELRRIHCKHLREVFASHETEELQQRGCITGRFVEGHAFVIESVTPVGLEILKAYEDRPAPR